MTRPTQESFAGGDQNYLKSNQYAVTDNLDARAVLHHRYTTASVRWQPWMVERIPWLKTGRVLEVGCGSGTIWELGRPELGDLRLTVSDLSVGMVGASIDVRRQVAPDELTTGVVSDAQFLPYPDDAFSLVIANHMLYHVPDPVLGIAEFARVLAPGGSLVAATNGADHMDVIREIGLAVFDELDSSLHMTVSVFGLENGAEKLGASFGEVELLRYDDSLTVTDAADLLAYMRSYPPGQHATAAELDSLVAEVDRRFTAGSGTVTVAKDVGLFIARQPR